MEWSKTKTIFIIIFLILDGFLIYQYISKKNANEYEFLAESSFVEELRENEITYTTLPKQKIKEQYLNATSKEFTDEELSKLKNQTIVNFNEHKVFSKLEKPFLLGENLYSQALNSFVKENVLYGDHYRFWKIDESMNSIIYYQTYNDKMIYNNSNAKLTLFLNNNREITSYEQTYLDNIEQFNEEKEVWQAIKALEMLYRKGYIPSKSTITNVDLGYYDLIQITSSHVLRPVWHVVLNDEVDLYVSAFDGQIIQSEAIPSTTDDKLME